ncbi:MAG: hypothetical protein CDV28_1178 [Candidatus Electronema aureum]|uniref:Uncharacterized protein n=1 Tax=Candidatus Electronema aureum TaxID=2005002 RepID=A0A521G159_9BACT|nr:MAG: hypothetical protein CDV28_1178 [Candidatus Electronema aureum]
MILQILFKDRINEPVCFKMLLFSEPAYLLQDVLTDVECIHTDSYQQCGVILGVDVEVGEGGIASAL